MLDNGDEKFKVQTFFLIPHTVSTVCLSKRSAHLVATGGTDGVAKIFKLGQTRALSSLGRPSGSKIACAAFDHLEEHLALGTATGELNLWDIASSNVAWSVPALGTGLSCLDFHPYGNFLASGSSDNIVRVWDHRAKLESHCFEGHTSRVQRLKHSPDGRTLVSGDVSGHTKLWDIVAGKIAHDFPVHEGEIAGMDFHPNECLLALAAGSWATLYDMATYEVVTATPSESADVRSAVFSQDGRVCVSATNSYIQLWGWEPFRQFAAAQVHWNDLADLAVSDMEELIGVSNDGSMVSMFKIDLTSFPSWVEIIDDQNLDLAGDVQEVQIHARSSSPEHFSSTCLSSAREKAVSLPSSQELPSNNLPMTSELCMSYLNSSTSASTFISQTSQAILPAKSFFLGSSTTRSAAALARDTTPHQVEFQPDRPTAHTSSYVDFAQSAIDSSVAASLTASPAETTNRVTRSKAAPSRYREQMRLDKQKHREKIARANERFGSHSMDSTGPQEQCPLGLVESEQEAVCRAIHNEHGTMMQLLTKRLANLRALKDLWAQGQVASAISLLRSMDDASTSVDFLNATERTMAQWLDTTTVSELLYLIQNLLNSRFESHVACALRALRLIFQASNALVSNTTKLQLKAIYQSVLALPPLEGKVSVLAREVADLLKSPL